MCVIHTPPKRPFHTYDFTRDRILLSGTSPFWKVQIVSDIGDHPVDLFLPEGDDEWELQCSSFATIIVVALYNSNDIMPLTMLSRYKGTGKLVVFCSEEYPYAQQAKLICEFDNTPVVQTMEDLIDAVLIRLGLPRKYKSVNIPTQ